MLLQNTVDPWSNLVRDRSRIATFMGNRGVAHDSNRQIKTKTWETRRWICCARDFKGIDRRPLFKTEPFSYSELFFLDEATAYAAGHRPCNDCRKEALSLFKSIWLLTHRDEGNTHPLTVKEIDDRLHSERLDHNGAKATYAASISSLPPGTMFSYEGGAFLVQADGIRRWTSSGYHTASADPSTTVAVLTPPSIVKMIQQGLPVQVHESALQNPD